MLLEHHPTLGAYLAATPLALIDEAVGRAQVRGTGHNQRLAGGPVTKGIVDWAAARRAALRPRRVALWRGHGELTRALLVMGLAVTSTVFAAILLHVPKPAAWSAPEVSWLRVGLWAVTVAAVVIPSGVALVTLDVHSWQARRPAPRTATPTAQKATGDPRWGRGWRKRFLRLGCWGGIAFGILLMVEADSWHTRLALVLTTLVAGACSCAALWWLGASAILLGGVTAAVVTFLVADWPWLYEPERLRTALLILIALIACTLLAVAREFSRAVLRLATVLAVGVVIVLTMKLGRLEARTEMVRDARRAATELDVQLADLLAEDRELPQPRTGQVERAQRALLAAAEGLDGSSGIRAALLGELKKASPPTFDLAKLRADARGTADISTLGLTETYEALRRIPRPDLESAGENAQHTIGRYCQAAEGRAAPVLAPPSASPPLLEPSLPVSQFGAASYEHCVMGGGSTDENPRYPGRPERFTELRTRATWAVALIRADVRDTPPEQLAAAGKEAVMAAGGPDANGAPVDLLAKGGVALLGGLPGAGDRSVPAAVTVVGWAALVGLLVLGYRWLEILNGRTRIGPVSVVPPSKEKGDPGETERKRLAELRRHIVRNIDEPGGVPGAETLQPVTDLLEATGQPSGKIVGALLKLVSLVFPRTGYTIEAVFSEAPNDTAAAAASVAVVAPTNGHAATGPPAATALTVTVIVKDARTGRGMTTITATGTPEQTALRQAGYRVAAWVLSRSSRVPSWASWDESTASALGEYTEATTRGSAGLAELEEAVRVAPASGVLLGLLGHRYDLDKRHTYALSAYLRAISLHPRYPTARYRAAISCSLLAANHARQWSAAGEPLRSELWSGLTAAGEVLGLTWSYRSHIDDGKLRDARGDQAVTPLACAGDDLLCMNGRALKKSSLIHHSFRRSERNYWLPLLLRFRSQAMETGSRRDALVTVNNSARPAVLWRAAAAATGEDRDSLERDARQVAERVQSARDLSWQVDYNLACAKAIEQAEGWEEEALAYLRGLVRRPHVGQLTREWVETDPDLEPLRSDDHLAELELFLRHLRNDPGSEWTTLLQRHVERGREQVEYSKLVETNPTVGDAQAVFTGQPLAPTALHDLRLVGETSLRVWQHLPVSKRRQLPPRVRKLADQLLSEEWNLLVEAMRQGSVTTVGSSDPGHALERARRAMLPRPWVAITTPRSTPATIAALSGATRLQGPASMTSPILVSVDQPPLTGLTAQPLRFDRLVGADQVRFVLHERIGFTRREGSLVVVLSGLE